MDVSLLSERPLITIRNKGIIALLEIMPFVLHCFIWRLPTLSLISLIIPYFRLSRCQHKHRHREKKNRFHRVDRKYYLYKPPLASQYHWLYPGILYLMKLQIASIVCLLQGSNFDASPRVDSQETPVKFMYSKSTRDLCWKCCLST